MAANTPDKRDMKRLQDASTSPNLNGEAILPAAAQTTYSTTGIDLSQLWSTSKGSAEADVEILIRVPNLTVAEMVNADTLKVSFVVDTVVPIDASSKVLMLDVISMLGAGGIGDLGEEVRVKVPSGGFVYQGTKYDIVGVKVVHTGTGEPSDLGGTDLGRCYVDVVF